MTFGRSTRCYDLDETFLSTFLERACSAIFEGPVPSSDDALRNDEIAVAALWQRLPRIHRHSVHLVGHGVLEGTVGRARRSDLGYEAARVSKPSR